MREKKKAPEFLREKQQNNKKSTPITNVRECGFVVQVIVVVQRAIFVFLGVQLPQVQVQLSREGVCRARDIGAAALWWHVVQRDERMHYCNDIPQIPTINHIYHHNRNHKED